MHPGSVNARREFFPSPWLIYGEMVAGGITGTQLLLRDCTMVGLRFEVWGLGPRV